MNATLIYTHTHKRFSTFDEEGLVVLVHVGIGWFISDA